MGEGVWAWLLLAWSVWLSWMVGAWAEECLSDEGDGGGQADGQDPQAVEGHA